MQVIEFSTEINKNNQIEVPQSFSALFQKNKKVRIIILVDEDAEELAWNNLTAKQFADGYDAEDSIYDQL